MNLLIFIIVSPLIIFGSYILIQLYRIIKLPASNPRAFLRKKVGKIQDNVKVVACIGDSITHGHVGTNYVKMLDEKLNKGGKNYEVINAGINSELAWNVKNRLEDIIACKPDYISILIGTNDANCVLTKRVLKRTIKLQKLPRTPDAGWYEENLRQIIQRLKNETRAFIAVLSLPTIGEDLNDPALEQSIKYSNIIKKIAKEENVVYLPLNEMMVKLLKKNPSHPKHVHAEQDKLMYKMLFLNKLGFSLDRIARMYGFQYHCDFLHLNDAGAKLVVDLIFSFIRAF
ncbi:MAG: SGNH/GDSL hydrolase family protein [Promethearchaeota archaeon]